MIAVLAVIATAIGTTVVYYGVFQNQVKTDLMISAKLLKDTRYFENVNIDTDKIDLSADLGELRVTWIDRDGTVLYDNDRNAVELANHGDRPEIKAALNRGEGESVRQSNTMNSNTFYYALLLDNGTILRVSTEADSMWYVVYSVIPLICFIVLIVIVLSVGLSYMLTKQLIAPIETMAKNIEDSSIETPYKELIPFAKTIKQQHNDILSAAKMRQDFTANVSHELKTPLTAISGYAELLQSPMEDKETAKHFLAEIRKNSDRLLSLINDIIKLSELDRNEKEYFETVDLFEVVEECMETLNINAQKRKVNLQFAGEHCKIFANRDMIRDLTDNLVQNAVRYNNEYGNVWVKVYAHERPMLVVKDNGIGIPKEDQSRIFERFYRVDKSRSKETGGTGLGLAIVKHIVEIHDAEIEIRSQLNEGTEVKVIF